MNRLDFPFNQRPIGAKGNDAQAASECTNFAQSLRKLRTHCVHARARNRSWRGSIREPVDSAGRPLGTPRRFRCLWRDGRDAFFKSRERFGGDDKPWPSASHVGCVESREPTGANPSSHAVLSDPKALGHVHRRVSALHFRHGSPWKNKVHKKRWPRRVRRPCAAGLWSACAMILSTNPTR